MIDWPIFSERARDAGEERGRKKTKRIEEAGTG
jgi:hypothetical protein